MLQVTPQSTVYIATTSIDFRKGIDGIISFCKNQLSIDPFDGAIFLFYNKSRTTIKILTYDGQGFWLCIKRLSHGKFQYNPFDTSSNMRELCYRTLQILINDGNISSINFSKNWRNIAPNKN